MKLLVIATLIGITCALVIPQQKNEGLNCGLKNAYELIKFPGQAATLNCEVCLDLVQIVEMYAECGEAFIQQQLTLYCKKKLGAGSIPDRTCEQLVNDVMGELEKGTNVDPSTTCTNILNAACKYDGSK